MDYNKINKKNVKFVAIAEWGAMGRAGCIELLSQTNNKLIYYLGNENIYNGKKIMDLKEFYQVFSEFKDIRIFIDECSGLSKNWKYLPLGMGNHLFISSDVYDYFKILIDYVPRKTRHPYQIWMTCAQLTLTLLKKGFTDKDKFIKKIKKINFTHKSDDIPIIEVWNNYIYRSRKYYDFEKISLDKIDNPQYAKNLEKQSIPFSQRLKKFLKFIIIYFLICIIFEFLKN